MAVDYKFSVNESKHIWNNVSLNINAHHVMYQSVDENVTKRFARTLSYLSTRNNSSVFANSSLPVMVYNMCVC